MTSTSRSTIISGKRMSYRRSPGTRSSLMTVVMMEQNGLQEVTS